MKLASLSKNFQNNVLRGYPSQGQYWLDNLPSLVHILAQKWDLQNLHPVENLTYNYVAKGKQNQNPIILKVSINLAAIYQESSALKIIKNYGGVKIIDNDDKNGGILLEQLDPGDTLRTFFLHREVDSIDIVCQLIKKLHRSPYPSKSCFRSLENWFEPLEKEWAGMESYLTKGRYLKKILCRFQSNDVFLHGDIHHDNIIRHGLEWRLIDPKGIIGHPLYDICNFIINPLEAMNKLSNPEKIIQNRVNIFAQKLNIDSNLISQWCFIYTILSTCWLMEDNQETLYHHRLLKYFNEKC